MLIRPRRSLPLSKGSARQPKAAPQVGAALAMMLLGLGLLFAPTARAASYNPTNAAGLVAAISNANASSEDDVIDLGGSTITLTAAADPGNGLPQILDAASAGKLTIENGTIARDGAAPQFRILYLDSGADLTLDHVTLSNGHAPDGSAGSPGGSGSDGGAIYNDGGTLTLTHSILSANRAGDGGTGGNGAAGIPGAPGGNGGAGGSGASGGPGGNGGAIYNTGALTLIGSTLSANQSGSGGSGGVGGVGGDGGGVPNIPNGGAGGAGGAGGSGGDGGSGSAIDNNGGTLSLIDCALTSNQAGGGGAGGVGGAGGSGGNGGVEGNGGAGGVGGAGGFGGNGGAISGSGTLTLTGSTLSANHAGAGGFGGNGGVGGIAGAGAIGGVGGVGGVGGSGGSGGAIYYAAGTPTLASDTLAANQAGAGGLGGNGGAGGPSGSGGTPGLGGSLGSGGAGGTGSAVDSTAVPIFNGSILSGGALVCAGFTAPASGQYNLITDTSCGSGSPFLVGGSSTTAGALNLGALQNNGGPTQTMALGSGSAAIDAVPSGCPATDQRGVARPQGAACDAGAYELDATPPAVTVEQASGQADPATASPIHFTVVFSEPIDLTSFTASDVTLGGTAPGTLAVVISQIAPNDGTTFDLAVSGMTGSGTVTAAIAANQVTDLALNGNTASTSVDNTVTYDATAPTVTTTSLLSTYVGVGPSSFTVTFSEPVIDTGSAGGDSVANPANYLLVEAGSNGAFDTLSCAGGVVSDDRQIPVSSVTYDGGTMTATVTPGSGLPLGRYRLFVCGTTSITDLAGNRLNGGADSTFDFSVVPIASVPALGFTGLALLALLLAAAAGLVLRRSP